MKHKIISIIILININFIFFAQSTHSFKVPDKIPAKVEQFVDAHAHEILNSSKSKKLTIGFLVDDNGIYKIVFLQNNELIYYDSKIGKVLSITNLKTTNVKSLGTQDIALGWFRDLPNFGGAAEQAHHIIEVAKSSLYWEFNVKQVSWGYSSHHFETDLWWDCYGKYTHTTQKVILYKRIPIFHGIRLVSHEYSGYETNYSGDYFSGTNIPVDNNVTEYKIEFKIDFIPTYISGVNVICQTQPTTFSIQNIPSPLNSISWTKSNNLDYISGQGTVNYKVKPTQLYSEAWVKAVLNTGCGNITLTKTF
ncbi:MAG: hypothetical protein L3J74_04445 [Bacteroidales bacterium]|nr:hypothetical protein [Bacteroidales bacterium]